MNFVIFKDIRPPKTNKRFTKAGKVSDFSTRFTGTTTKYVFLVLLIDFYNKVLVSTLLTLRPSSVSFIAYNWKGNMLPDQ